LRVKTDSVYPISVLTIPCGIFKTDRSAPLHFGRTRVWQSAKILRAVFSENEIFIFRKMSGLFLLAPQFGKLPNPILSELYGLIRLKGLNNTSNGADGIRGLRDKEKAVADAPVFVVNVDKCRLLW
jgi:hypothetical protein